MTLCKYEYRLRKGVKKMTLIDINIKQAGYQTAQATITNVQFSVKPGELIGMIGTNGAGKSTTIKALLGELPFIDGEIKGLEQITYSYIPERPVFYQELTLWEHFEFVNAVEQLDDTYLSYAEEILQKFHLLKHIHEFPETFSKGMQQKGMIALALFTKPDLLIIDEPFMGLDPGSTTLFLHMIEKEQAKGTGILMSTHILDTAERICDGFIVIEKGTVKASGKFHEVLAQCQADEESLYACISVEEDDSE